MRPWGRLASLPVPSASPGDILFFPAFFVSIMYHSGFPAPDEHKNHLEQLLNYKRPKLHARSIGGEKNLLLLVFLKSSHMVLIYSECFKLLTWLSPQNLSTVLRPCLCPDLSIKMLPPEQRGTTQAFQLTLDYLDSPYCFASVGPAQALRLPHQQSSLKRTFLLGLLGWGGHF